MRLSPLRDRRPADPGPGIRSQRRKAVHTGWGIVAWLEGLRHAGIRAGPYSAVDKAFPLAAGVEGAIYDLGDGLVAKVGRDRRPAELVRMQRFYADVAAAGLPFSTPEILAVEQVERTTVTYERKLRCCARRKLRRFARRATAAISCHGGIWPSLAACRTHLSLSRRIGQLSRCPSERERFSCRADRCVTARRRWGRDAFPSGSVVDRLRDFSRREVSPRGCLPACPTGYRPTARPAGLGGEHDPRRSGW